MRRRTPRSTPTKHTLSLHDARPTSRPPIRAGRDLPAEGLGPVAWVADEPAVEEQGEEEEEALVLADVAPVLSEQEAEEDPADESHPWLQPASDVAYAVPDPADESPGRQVPSFGAGKAQSPRREE